MTREELTGVLCRYESAIQENEDEHSDETILELEKARNALMDVLLTAKNSMEII
jgi:hypothetical protein